MNHDEITAKIGGKENYGKGILPNPFVDDFKEYRRRKEFSGARAQLSAKIESLLEPRFITPPETAEAIESLITLTDSRKILEIGTCTGFTTLHMLRAVIGKEGAHVTSIDARPAHDKEFFAQPWIKPWFRHIEGWTPQCLSFLNGQMFDCVFVDSDHSVEHSGLELIALLPITKAGTLFLFHDCPERDDPKHPVERKGTVFRWLQEKVAQGYFRGTCLPSCEQLDCLDAWGPGYPRECNPGLGVFIRL